MKRTVNLIAPGNVSVCLNRPAALVYHFNQIQIIPDSKVFVLVKYRFFIRRDLIHDAPRPVTDIGLHRRIRF